MSLMRRLLWGLPVVGALAAGGLLLTQKGESAPERGNGGHADAAKPADLKPAVSLPISQVILFNSGVGHFTRSGEVEGDARVDLTFPEQDVNDLIKSMTLRDLSPNGRVAAVTYDSHDPIDRTLASFAINLNNSPPLAAILAQDVARHLGHDLTGFGEVDLCHENIFTFPGWDRGVPRDNPGSCLLRRNGRRHDLIAGVV